MGISIGSVSGSDCSSWGDSCCGIVLFSFSASAAGSSIPATVAFLALTAVSADEAGVSSTALPCGHGGTQSDTSGNHGCYDELLHFSFSLADAKRTPNPIAVRQETGRSFS